MTFDIKILV